MFQSAKAKVPGNNFSGLATSKPVSSVSPSTHLLYLYDYNLSP
jgi:hypothetical protein